MIDTFFCDATLVLQADRSAVEPERLPSLEVIVVSTALTQPPGSIFPIAGEPQYHYDITYGRPGGARRQAQEG